jgi:hypothetical protein
MYAALVFSGGLFAPVWLAMLVRDAGRLEPQSKSMARGLRVAIATLWISYVAIFVWNIAVPEERVVAGMIALAFATFLSIPVALAYVYRVVRLRLGLGFRVRDALVVVGTTLAMLSSFILVQERLNTLVASAYPNVRSNA